MKFGVTMFPADYAMSVVELGRAVEGNGLESLFLPEHTHMPLDHSPWPGGAELPAEYKHTLDPFVALGAVAAATSRIKLGTGICLVIQRDPIVLAKEIATLDQLSNGRFLFGIGAGWNRPEIENHGVRPPVRWRVLRERVLAMKEIWTRDEAEYHGEFVNFDKLWAWPKPIQKPHPPVIMGGDGQFAERHALEYCDGWLPRPGRGDQPLEVRLADLNRRCAEAGRPPLEHNVFGIASDPKVVEDLQAAGVDRVLFRLPPASSSEVLPAVAKCAEVARSFS